jgi:murein DD-endopeptidase MepM/ murein hydrolase activator NlpD
MTPDARALRGGSRLNIKDVRRSLASLYEQAFVPREIFFRSGDRFHHLRLSVRVQQIAACIAAVIAVWSLYATGSYVVNEFVLASKDAEIKRNQLAYFDLLSEVGEYHDQFAKITRNLEENQKYLLSLLEKGPQAHKDMAAVQEQLKDSETEHARVVIAREGLREKMQKFESDLRDIASRNVSLQSKIAKMRAVADQSRAERDEVAAARERLTQRLAEVENRLAQANDAKTVLESRVEGLAQRLDATEKDKAALAEARTKLNAHIAGLERELSDAQTKDDALKNQIAELDESLARSQENTAKVQAQRDHLDRRAAGLEQRLVDLRDAGQSVIERLSERTRLSLDMIESTVKMTGLDINTLLKDSPDGLLGQGGPFIPADEVASFEPSFQLETSVTTLDQQIDRWTVLQDVVRSLPLTAPLDQYRISSRFGKRHDPVNGRRAKHLGTDFAAALGSPVYSTAPGKVTFAGRRGRYGRLVEIDHGYGIRTRYAHLRKILVKVGQEVGNREKIALLGSSGRSTGPHVHYEVRYKGRAQNPMKFLKAGNHVFKG